MDHVLKSMRMNANIFIYFLKRKKERRRKKKYK